MVYSCQLIQKEACGLRYKSLAQKKHNPIPTKALEVGPIAKNHTLKTRRLQKSKETFYKVYKVLKISIGLLQGLAQRIFSFHQAPPGPKVPAPPSRIGWLSDGRHKAAWEDVRNQPANQSTWGRSNGLWHIFLVLVNKTKFFVYFRETKFFCRLCVFFCVPKFVFAVSGVVFSCFKAFFADSQLRMDPKVTIAIWCNLNRFYQPKDQVWSSYHHLLQLQSLCDVNLFFKPKWDYGFKIGCLVS